MHVDAERIHVGQTLFRRPSGARRQRLPAAPDDGHLGAPRILLALEGVPVAAVLGGAPEALGRQMGMDVDAAHSGFLLAVRYAPSGVGYTTTNP